MKAFGEAVGLIIALVVIVWGMLIHYATPDQKPVIACKPVLFLTGGLQNTVAAASSTNSSSTAPTNAHVVRLKDADTGRTLTMADRAALTCLRFTDRLINK